MYTVIVDKQVAKQIEKIPTVFRTRICDAIASLGLDPYPQGVVKLVGETGLYRIASDWVITGSFMRFKKKSLR